MSKSKRKNYLIDKPFQLGFITRYLIIILVTIILAFGVVVAIYAFQSIVYKLDMSVIVMRKAELTHEGGGKVYDYEDEQIQIYESKDNDGNIIYKCYNPKGNKNFKKDDIVENVNKEALLITYGPKQVVTNKLMIILLPMVITALVLMIFITIYSLFFSHRMAGPIYRIRISMDRMLTGDCDFKIRARKTDFFLNIVDRLEKIRQQIQNKKDK